MSASTTTATFFDKMRDAAEAGRRHAAALDRPLRRRRRRPAPSIRKYIFPGGYIPALSEVLPAIEKSGLMVTDVEILRLHYADTLKHWRERFMANRERAKAIYDERFCRMWEFYLAGSEAAFRWQDMMVFQIQLTRRNDTLPLTRGYMEKCEKALAMHEIAHGKAAEPKRPNRQA